MILATILSIITKTETWLLLRLWNVGQYHHLKWLWKFLFQVVADLKLTMCHLYHLLKPIGRKAASHFVINRYSLPSHDAFLSPGTSRVATLNCILMAHIKFSTEFLWLFEIVVLLCLLGTIIYSWRVLALFIGIKLRVPCF